MEKLLQVHLNGMIKFFIPFYFLILFQEKLFAQTDSFKVKSDTVYTMAELPFDEDSLWRFLKSNCRLPGGKDSMEGRVVIEFVVNEDGTLSNFKVVKGMGIDINRAILDFVKKLPKFKPATRNKQPIKQKFTLPFEVSYN